MISIRDVNKRFKNEWLWVFNLRIVYFSLEEENPTEEPDSNATKGKTN